MNLNALREMHDACGVPNDWVPISILKEKTNENIAMVKWPKNVSAHFD